MLEPYKTGTGQQIMVHSKVDCRGEHCIIHNPSNHSMSTFPTHWRYDRAIIERICPHGIGHPDPDDVEFAGNHLSELQMKYYSVHGCDGCCSNNVDNNKST